MISKTKRRIIFNLFRRLVLEKIQISKSFKRFAQLSHFISMMFGIALGITICMLYQHFFAIFIIGLTPLVVLIVILGACLRLFTILLWRKNNYHFQLKHFK